MNLIRAIVIRWQKLIYILVFISCSLSASAQFEPLFTQYMFNETFINPAYVGSHECISAGFLYRNQWVGIDGSPKTQTFSIHSPTNNNKIGIGLSIMNESIGVTKQLVVNGNFAYRIIMPTSTFAFGIQAGFVNDQENLTQVQTNVSGDNQFSSNIRKYFLPNAGFGMYYKTDRFYAGLSIPRLLENKIKLSQTETIVRNVGNPKIWHYYIAAGYVMDLNESVKFKPSLMLKAVVNAPMEIDLNANFLINELLWVGGGYRSGDACSAMFGIQLSKNLRINYSYDYTVTGLQKYNSGSHEITLGYDLSFSKDRIISPRYF